MKGILGNPAAVKAHQEGTLPFPDGTVLAKLTWQHVPLVAFDGVFVPGAPVRLEFMVKDSQKCAATGGWGFGRFVDGKSVDEAQHKTCFPATKHTRRRATSYSPGLHPEHSRLSRLRYLNISENALDALPEAVTGMSGLLELRATDKWPDQSSDVDLATRAPAPRSYRDYAPSQALRGQRPQSEAHDLIALV